MYIAHFTMCTRLMCILYIYSVYISRIIDRVSNTTQYTHLSEVDIRIQAKSVLFRADKALKILKQKVNGLSPDEIFVF